MAAASSDYYFLHSCSSGATASVAGSRDAQNASSVVVKDGGQEESEL